MIDFRSIEPNEPIVLKDHTLGICIRFSESEIGVQVPGEQAIRWLPTSCVERSATGLIEKGLDISQNTRMSQQIITGVNRDGSYNTVDGTTFDGKKFVKRRSPSRLMGGSKQSQLEEINHGNWTKTIF